MKKELTSIIILLVVFIAACSTSSDNAGTPSGVSPNADNSKSVNNAGASSGAPSGTSSGTTPAAKSIDSNEKDINSVDNGDLDSIVQDLDEIQ